MIQALLVFLTGLTLPGITGQGDRFFFYDARSGAMGGVSIVLDNAANPASLAFHDGRSLVVSGRLDVHNERRGLRVYDSYGNNIGIATVANNTATYAGAGSCAFVYALRSVSFGLQYAPVWDHNYNYYEEQRDDFYQLIGTEELSYRGGLNALAPAVAFRYRAFSVGLEQGFLFGAVEMTRTVTAVAIPDSVYREEAQMSGRRTKFGIALAPSVNFRFAYTYQHQYTLDDAGAEYPAVHAIGVMYQPPGRIPTKFAAQVEYEAWSGSYGDNILIYKIGVEHMIQNRYYMRYGFCVFPDYQVSSIWTTNLAAGIGMTTGRYFIDLAYAYGKRDYRALDYPSWTWIETDYVFDETSHHLLVSTGVHF